jgi:hypothetical protein
MDEFTKDLFKREIGRQCNYGVAAKGHMDRAYGRTFTQAHDLEAFWSGVRPS